MRVPGRVCQSQTTGTGRSPTSSLFRGHRNLSRGRGAIRSRERLPTKAEVLEQVAVQGGEVVATVGAVLQPLEQTRRQILLVLRAARRGGQGDRRDCVDIAREGDAVLQ